MHCALLQARQPLSRPTSFPACCPLQRIILPIAPFYTWIVPMFMLGYRPALYKGMLADINGAKKAA
jgi:hypothetical protein